MKLIYKPTGQEIKLGSIIPCDSSEVEVIYCPPPHKPSSEGKMQVRYKSNDVSGLYYCSCFDCEWIDREDREEPIKLIGKFSPVRTADQITIEQIALMQKKLAEQQDIINRIDLITKNLVNGAEDDHVEALAKSIQSVIHRYL